MKTWLVLAFIASALLGSAQAKAGILTPDDEKIYRQAFEAVHKQDYDRAMSLSNRAHDKLLRKAVQWATYVTPNSGATFGDITAFARANPTWPQMTVLMRRAEEAITVATPAKAVIEWFNVYQPVTVDGAMAYGKALSDAGQDEKAEPILRKAWITGNFGPMQERQFLASFRDILKPEDHWARLDRLLWEHQDQIAEQQMVRVDEAHQILARARLALDNDASNAESLVHQVPERLKNDPGLIYEQLHYRRVHEMDDQAIALLSHPSHDKVHPEMWWTERSVLARRALQQGHVSEAYQIAHAHAQADGAGFADAEWLSGWIALRFLDDREVALAHFSRMFDRVQTPQSRSRAAYWAGRASGAMGKGDDAARWYGEAATYVTTFYGQLAEAHLHRDQLWPLPSDPLPSASEIESFEHNELVRVARMLGQIKETDLIRPFMLRMNDIARGPGQRALAANLAHTLGRNDIAVAVAKRSEREGVPLIASGYPIPPVTLADYPERPLVLGLIRQESAFHYEAVSSVGARGLMQLMPATAEKVAKTLNLSFKKKNTLNSALTNDPNLNVRLGSAFLGDLLRDFDGSYVLAIAAYNAGPTRVRRWVRDMGDPRSSEVDVIDWIESIPYSETRNYTQRVLEGTQIYRRRLGTTGLVASLERDLKRQRAQP